MPPALLIALVAAALLFVLWLGLRVQPRPFGLPALQQRETRTVPLPAGLLAPVERFYRTVYGEQVPVIETVALAGRGHMRPFGIWLPARFVMVHNAGRDYRHYFEATFFGLPFLRVNEGYLDGKSFFESPMGSYHDDPNTNQGANLALWAEGAWFPALWITDPRALAGGGCQHGRPVRALRSRRGKLCGALQPANRAGGPDGSHALQAAAGYRKGAVDHQ